MAKRLASFPKIASSTWWKLRDLFKTKVPTAVTTSYLATALSMTEDSARANILTPFKKIGILDAEGRPTDLAYDWRDDAKYPEVCKKLLDRLYPQEVQDLFPDANADTSALTSWFMSQARCGKVAAAMYSAFYRLLLKADPSESQESKQNQAQNTPKTPRRRVSEAKAETRGSERKSNEETRGQPIGPKASSFGSTPQLHINIQLHIAPETTADQIDQIFESMAKHLKPFHE